MADAGAEPADEAETARDQRDEGESLLGCGACLVQSAATDVLGNHGEGAGGGRDHDDARDHGEQPGHAHGGDGVGAEAADDEDIGDAHQGVDLRRQRDRHSNGEDLPMV